MGYYTMKLTYLGFHVSDSLFGAINCDGANNSVQTQKFSGKILKALSQNYQTYNFSCPSMVEYPKSKVLFTKFESFENDCEKNIVFPVINVFILKQIGQFICALFLVVRHPSAHYICHGLNLPHMLALVLMKLFSGASICILVTDPPVSESKFDGFIKRHSRLSYIYVVGVLVNKFDYMIALSPALREVFNFKGKFLFIEGVA
jgi:hypothetical protein